MPDKKEADLTAILREFQKFAPHRTKAEIQTILTKAIDYLHRSKALESAAPSALQQAEKDTQNHLTSRPLSKDKNMENNEKEKTDKEGKEAVSTISNLPAELLPLVTKHLKAAGLPDHFIDCLHENAFGKKTAPPIEKKVPKQAEKPQADAKTAPKNSPEANPMAADHQTEADYHPEDILSAYVHQMKSKSFK